MNILHTPYKASKNVSLKAVESDRRLSGLEVAVLWYLLSRPKGWRFNKRDIINRRREGKHAHETAFNDLKRHGYLRIERTHNAEGKFVWKWWVSDHPLADQIWNRLLTVQDLNRVAITRSTTHGLTIPRLATHGQTNSGPPGDIPYKKNNIPRETTPFQGVGSSRKKRSTYSPAHARENPDRDSGEVARKNGATSSHSSRELVHDNPEAGAFAKGSSPAGEDLPDDVIISRKGNPYRQLGPHPDSGNMVQAGRTKRGSYVADPQADVWVDLRENEDWKNLTLYDAVHIMAQRAAHHRSLKYGTVEERDDYLEEQVFPGLEIVRG